MTKSKSTPKESCDCNKPDLVAEAKRAEYGACPWHKGHVDGESIVSTICIGAFVCVVVGMLSFWRGQVDEQTDAIRYGVARHDAQNGAFEWSQQQPIIQEAVVTYVCVDADGKTILQSGTMDLVTTDNFEIANPGSYKCRFTRMAAPSGSNSISISGTSWNVQ